MPTINGTEVNTVKYDGKIFVLECSCKKMPSWELGRYWENKFIGGNDKCSKCNDFPWIILPKKENK